MLCSSIQSFCKCHALTVSIAEGTDERIINLNKVVVLRRKLNQKIKKIEKYFYQNFNPNNFYKKNFERYFLNNNYKF